VRARVTVPAEAPSGLHEVRALTGQGVTNPLYFFVSQYAQVPEREPNNSLGQANEVKLPATLAGVINGGQDEDCFAFSARRGEWLVFDVEGFKRFAPAQNQQQGIVYLDSFIMLRDAAGRELAYDDDSHRVDAFLAYQFPADGKYIISIRDSIYRGRGDFHYRLTVGNRPAITALFPPGGQRGTRVVTTVYGFNLDSSGATSIRQAIGVSRTEGTQEFRVNAAGGVSNALPLVSGAFEEVSEAEPNDRVQDATPVTLPATCNGKFDRLTDVDGYRFQAQGGQRLVCAVEASRFGSPVDTFLTLINRSGQVIASDDDGGGMPDARLEVNIPNTDEYVIFVRNQVKTGSGPQHFYRLTLRSLRPGFRVTLRQEGVDNQGRTTQVPVDSVAVQRGGSVEFEVLLNRYEGQSGDVKAEFNFPPSFQGLKMEKVIRTPVPGGGPQDVRVTIEPQTVVRNGQNTCLIRLIAAEDAPVGTHLNLYLRLSGTAGAQPFVLNQPFWVTIMPK
jgi:hypothetical protein